MPDSSDQSIAPVEDNSGLACFAIMLSFLGIPESEQQLRHQFALQGPVDAPTILRMAKTRGLKSRILHGVRDSLATTPMPAIARMRDGRFVVVARADAERVLIKDPSIEMPSMLPVADFVERWDGTLILITKRATMADMGRAFNISWFLPAIYKYRRILGEVLLASFFLQVLGLISPIFFQLVIDKVLVHRGMSTLDVLVIGLLIVSSFEVVLGALRTYVFSHTTNRIDVELGARLFQHLLQLPLAYFQARRVGDSVARVRELENIRSFLTGSALTLVIDLLFTIVFLAVMFVYSALLTWIVIGSLPFYFFISLWVSPLLRRRVDEKFRRGAVNQGFLVESITGIETVKAMAVEPQMQARWEEQLAGYVSASFATSNLGNIASQGVQFVNKATIAATLYFGAKLVIDGDLTVGQLVAFNMLSQRVSSPVLRIAQLWQDFQQARISIDRLGDILNTPREMAMNTARAELPPIRGALAFEHVTFRYRLDGPPTLTDIDFRIESGQVIGIVGPSGSGKSTLTKLVQRLYIPEAGRITVDGVDLRQVDTTWLRRQTGVVLQENMLFNRSVRENIALSDPGTSMDRIIAAATLAGAHEFIVELPHGYDTEIGERGTTLSGGQRQRLAIARALITNPRILIFDEATSALDYESEAVIRANMRHICKGRTVIVISHRLSIVRDSDRILTIEKGRLVEDGTHDQLVAANGRYAQLWRLQEGGDHV
jgi:subfamily B ATP-binding cassette protein HlyB/CyaB